jgi:hypothetical protein
MLKFAIKKNSETGKRWQDLLIECNGKTCRVRVDSTSPSALWCNISGDKDFRVLIHNREPETRDPKDQPTVKYDTQRDENFGNR